ncbi:transmembrane amino acid transporter protein-domain-containing protein [Aspergillus pseudoustus]|uniref:Transmembrane amino acid transporter protein-domain-containing protein n=1 Tax=Aspergillus pseudoustus TaxID=1810923 RepID=A0ABR4JCA4_9EURO
MSSNYIDKKALSVDSPHCPAADDAGAGVGNGSVIEQNDEVFGRGDGDVDFCTVGWMHAAMIFLKIIFATGVLSIPSVMFDLGAVPGSIVLVSFTVLNGYSAIIQGNFRRRHPSCHSIADMAGVVGGVVLREITSVLFVASYVITAASGIIGVSASLNALSSHAACTIWWSLIATVVIFLCASIRRFSNISWLTWVGFFSVFTAVLVVVIGVTLQDRPAAAPPTGDFDLGFNGVGHPSFAAGVSAAITMFVSCAATSAFLPVMAEMKQPKDYDKAVYVCMGFVTASYLAFTMVMYYWCGQWIASPSLGSAGPVLKKVSYGIAFPGLIVSGCLYVHVPAKYLFVRILRNSEHLQKSSWIHWATWLSCTSICSILAFILASAIPIFNYILALVGSVCYAPLTISLPGLLWVFDHWHPSSWKESSWQRKAALVFHLGLILLGLFMMVSGTYSVALQIRNAYAQGTIDSAFSCADNSGTV